MVFRNVTIFNVEYNCVVSSKINEILTKKKKKYKTSVSLAGISRDVMKKRN